MQYLLNTGESGNVLFGSFIVNLPLVGEHALFDHFLLQYCLQSKKKQERLLQMTSNQFRSLHLKCLPFDRTCKSKRQFWFELV